MESQPQNPEFRINPENFHPWIRDYLFAFFSKIYLGQQIDFGTFAV